MFILLLFGKPQRCPQQNLRQVALLSGKSIGVGSFMLQKTLILIIFTDQCLELFLCRRVSTFLLNELTLTFGSSMVSELKHHFFKVRAPQQYPATLVDFIGFSSKYGNARTLQVYQVMPMSAFSPGNIFIILPRMMDYLRSS